MVNLGGTAKVGATATGSIAVGGALVGGSGSAYRVAGHFQVQAAGDAKTNEKGEFALIPTATGTLNIEAVKSDASKAFKAQITYISSASAPIAAGTLNLAPTGSIAGRVTAPEAPTIKTFQGVDVYIPGSSYLAKCDKDGFYTISSVAAGTFNLAAEKQGLGKANAAGIAV